MFARDVMKQMEAKIGASLQRTSIPEEQLPASADELSLHMQLSYKQGVEIAEEEAINQVLDQNKWELIKRRINYDLVTCGIGAVKTSEIFPQLLDVKSEPEGLEYEPFIKT